MFNMLENSHFTTMNISRSVILKGFHVLMSAIYILAVSLVYTGAVSATSPPPPPPCERAPPHAQPASSLYRLAVSGEPDLFLPGELYTVSLQGINSGEGPTPFIGFVIWAELDTEEVEGVEGGVDNPTNFSLGVFQAYDAQSKVHDHCTSAVTNATTHPKVEIQVIWNAPVVTVDVCIRLCASASPLLNASKPSILARKICAAPKAPASFLKQPPILEPCCACDEAKYEVTFEGIWSRNMHPRSFPAESYRAHFGDVIGASHTAQYRVWQEGRVASAGMRRLADDGATTALEKELKAESDHIRTIIKARGISWQQVASTVAPSTFAVFRVDAKHHLVSLAAKLAPSPDWIVGVSALELCNKNCTWRRSATLPLYPYDAGTDSGIGYTSQRQPTVPPAPVRALRPDWPKDDRSPFYNTKGEMRPFARLRLNRLRLYEKSCDAVDSRVERPAEPKGGACATHEWGAWAPCSVTCGAGRSTRQRKYVWPARAHADACRVPLTDHGRCYGPRRHCRAPSPYEPDPASVSGPCAVSAWSSWSPCEGCGVRSRTRHYLVPRAHKRCHVGFRARTVLSQAIPCEAGPCEKPPGDSANSTNYDWFFVDTLGAGSACPTSPWSSWSPCVAPCTHDTHDAHVTHGGRRVRTRLYVLRDSRLHGAVAARLQAQWTQRFAALQGIDYPMENFTSGDPELNREVDEFLERCQFTLTQQESLCDVEDSGCPGAEVSHEVCKLPMAVGPCRNYAERWFFDTEKKLCEPFGYTGCGGNSNNFRSWEKCIAVCGNYTVTTTAAQNIGTGSTATVPAAATVSKKSKEIQLKRNNEVLQNDAPSIDAGELDDCEVSEWLGWTSCFGDCNYAIKLNYRHILRKSSGAGRACPPLIKKRICRPHHCRKVALRDTSAHRTDGIELHSDNDYGLVSIPSLS